jgi:hypothetical protein
MESNAMRAHTVSLPISDQMPGLQVDTIKLMLHAVIEDLYADDEEGRERVERKFQDLLAITLTQAEEQRRQMELMAGQKPPGGLLLPNS